MERLPDVWYDEPMNRLTTFSLSKSGGIEEQLLGWSQDRAFPATSLRRLYVTNQWIIWETQVDSETGERHVDRYNDVLMACWFVLYHTAVGHSSQSLCFQIHPRSTRGPLGHCQGFGTCCLAAPPQGWTLYLGWGLWSLAMTTANRRGLAWWHSGLQCSLCHNLANIFQFSQVLGPQWAEQSPRLEKEPTVNQTGQYNAAFSLQVYSSIVIHRMWLEL